jgi:hypothetical protein
MYHHRFDRLENSDHWSAVPASPIVARPGVGVNDGSPDALTSPFGRYSFAAASALPP